MKEVTPLAGVWIEICWLSVFLRNCYVTPLAGVWIEIALCPVQKYHFFVTPLAGVWIEIKMVSGRSEGTLSHSPCGSVD